MCWRNAAAPWGLGADNTQATRSVGGRSCPLVEVGRTRRRTLGHVQHCATCGRLFAPSSRHHRCPACRAQAARHPCPGCGTRIQRNSKTCLSCIEPRDYRGASNPHWKGDAARHKSYHHYVYVQRPDHPRGARNRGYVLEHIVVMETTLGRYLLPGETVHHRNGDRADNRPENLELWVRPPYSGIRADDALRYARDLVRRLEGAVEASDVPPPEVQPVPNGRPGSVLAEIGQKEGRSMTKEGYVRVRAKGHPRADGGSRVREHILVMEQVLGRCLLLGETVHHRNGDRADNRPQNLELWVKAQASGIRAADALAWAYQTISVYGGTPAGAAR